MSEAQRTALVGGRVILADEQRTDLAVVVEGDLIRAVVPAVDVLPGGGLEILDVGGRIIAPGLVDVHVHGAAGQAFDTPDADATWQVLRALARCGVTSVQASLVSAALTDLDVRLHGLARIRQEQAAGHEVTSARLLGVHLEGPYLARAQCGAHDPAVLRTPEAADIELLIEHRDVLTMVTLAPELPGVVDLTRALSEAGVLVAAGHSDARGGDLGVAVEAGLVHLTHLWSGQSALIREGPWRRPGLLEESLASDGLTAEVIADGSHLPPALLEIARRCLGERLIVVSDGTQGTGMPEGFRYDLGTVTCEVSDGVGMVVGADAFGGSVTSLDQMVAYLHRELGWPLVEVLRMVTRTPAEVLGLGDRIGRIAPGYSADLVLFDEALRPTATMIAGTWVP